MLYDGELSKITNLTKYLQHITKFSDSMRYIDNYLYIVDIL